MKKEILETIKKILNDNDVQKAIEKNMSINTFEMVNLREYVENKLEQIYITERLEWLKTKLKDSDD